MKNETSDDASKKVINNSSMVTAENSSSIQSKFNQRKNKLTTLHEKKYSNTALFEDPKREWSKKQKKIPKDNLYITDVTLSKFRDTDFETKSTLQTTKNYPSYNSTKNRNKNSFFNTKSSLPYITNYNNINPKTEEQTYLQYFGSMLKNDEFVKKMKQNQEKKRKLKNKKSKTFRDDKNEYIRKTNEIKRLKYELNLKINAMEDYKENLKIQVNSFNHTMSNIQSYKEDIENNFITKYNDNLRKLAKTVYDKKLFFDEQNNKLKKLKNDVADLKQNISKKENIIKDIEKWIKLQIYMKEGKKPEILENALKKYKGKLIFNTMEELENNLSYKESQNLILIDKYNKSEKEKEKLIPWLNNVEKSYENLSKNFLSNINEKLTILNSLKKRERDLQLTINQLKEKNKDEEEKKETSTTKKININNKENSDNQILINELGIKYKPIKCKNNIYHYINCIFCGILANEISGLSLDNNDSNQLSNANLPAFKIAKIQMNFIELSLNHLISSINKKIISDKNSLQTMEKTCKIIDAYHKMKNVNRNKSEMKKKRNNILKKVEYRANKNYVFSRGKTDYNVVLEQKNKEIERLKNKKHLKNVDIWDFLHDI